MAMSGLREFHKAFSIKEDPDVEQRRFVQRINQTIFSHFEGDQFASHKSLFNVVCYELGINAKDVFETYNERNYMYDHAEVPPFRSLTRDDFMDTLKMLKILYDVRPTEREFISDMVDAAILRSTGDLGIRWVNGMFYPSGAEELDIALVSDVLVWLEGRPETKKRFASALSHFTSSRISLSARGDAITNAYSAVEQLAREILGNTANLANNKNELIKSLGVPSEYGNILHYYGQIANGYSTRHAGVDPTHEEAEFFIYLTGLLMRMLASKVVKAA